MKKKFFLGMFAATGMLLATSCSNDELIEQTSGDMATVSFTINTEGKAASRAIADGTTAQRLNYAIYHVVGNTRTKVEAKTVSMSDKKYTLECVLAKGQTYELGFWAQADNAPYTVTSNDSGMTVEVDYTSTVSNNDETRDAFTATRTITVEGNVTQEVMLKRPFAQINVGVTETNYMAASQAGAKIEKSSVELTGTFGKTFNVMTGDVTATQNNVSFTSNDIPAYESETLIVNGVNYKYLSTCYVLPEKVGQSQTVDAKFTFTPESGDEIKLQNGVSNLPIQSNWRTNIVGDILTSNVNVEVSIDQAFDGDNPEVSVWDGVSAEQPTLSSDDSYYEVSKPAHWAWLCGLVSSRSGDSNVLDKGIKLMGNIDFGGHKINPIRPTAGITIDGNGKTLSNFSLNHSSTSKYAVGLLSLEGFSKSSTLNIKNLNLDKVTAHTDVIDNENDPHGYAAVLIADVQNGATVNIDGVKVTNSSVKGIQSVGTLVGFLPDSSTVNVKNTTVEGNTLANIELADESGYVCGLVGKVAGTLKIESDVEVKNNKIEAYYASKRGAKSISESAAIRENGTITGSITASENTIIRKPVGVEADLLINTVKELQDFAKNYEQYNEKVVLLNNDLDLTGVDWTPIGYSTVPFCGTFNGYGNTIKNLTVTEGKNVEEHEGVAFFGWLGVNGTQATVKNLNFESAKITGHHYVAVVVGYLQYGTIENCRVENSEVNATKINDERKGDKVGAIVGYVNAGVVKDCKAVEVTVIAGCDAGQLIGCCTNSDVYNNFTDNEAEDVTVSGNGANINNSIIGRTN